MRAIAAWARRQPCVRRAARPAARRGTRALAIPLRNRRCREEGQLSERAFYDEPHPTRPSPKPPGLGSVLERNIRTLEERRAREAPAASSEERLAPAITRFTGSMRFVYLHLAIFGGWIIANHGFIPGIAQF